MRKTGFQSTAGVLCVLLAGLPDMSASGGQASHQGGDAPGNAAEAELAALLENHWDWTLERSPVFATSVGVRDYDDRLADPSLEAYDAHVAKLRGFRRRLERVDAAALGEAAALNRALLRLQLDTELEAAEHGGKYLLVTNRGGPHLSLARLPTRLPFFTEADFDSYVARLRAAPDYLARAADRLRAGIEAGWVQPCAPMAGYEASIRVHLVDDAGESAFLDPFDDRPERVPPGTFDDLKADAARAIENELLPALEAFERFYLREYAPACRPEAGIGSLPGGDAYYAYLARHYTTTDLAPAEIHKIGLREVARIRAEMDEVIARAGFEGSFAEWLDYLRTSPEFYPQTPEERIQIAAAISKRMDGELPKLFTRFPRMPYGIKPIPADIAEKSTTAYYTRPAGDGSRAGFYWINTTKLDTRPLYELEALSLHEAVPGHHFQIALAQELDLPPFRRYGNVTAFIEGWGLYAERLGLEVGFYDTPYSNFGRLSYEIWRACRLVVDTGIHAEGWTRERAIGYMSENTGLSLNNITTEVDRYITWPGQALAYKIGELKILELRERAETRLGPRFDRRRFHDALLENGALPLSILEERMRRWTAAQRTAPAH